MDPFQLRDARPDDASAIAAIYDHYVRTTCFTFEEVSPTPEEIVARMRKVRDVGLPYYVAQGQHNSVVGYAYASLFHARSAYRYSVENSVYVAVDRIRQGMGLALMQRLIARCTALGFRQMIALIGAEKDNPASIGLHLRLGFRSVGTLSAVGWKFGRWLDVVEMQLTLGDGPHSKPTDSAVTPAPPSPDGH
jgi:L-amino acid N-acyltransferase YncA